MRDPSKIGLSDNLGSVRLTVRKQWWIVAAAVAFVVAASAIWTTLGTAARLGDI